MGVLILLAVGFYFLPSFVAWARAKRNTMSIVVLNFFAGWTFVGWVVALVWAVSVDDRRREYQ